MRLNHVELFYALVAAIGSESRRCLRGRGGHMHAVCMQRWLATARAPAGAAGYGLATCKGWPATAKAPLQGGDRLQPRPPCKGAATRRHGRLRLARKGLSLTASPVANRGGDAGRRGGRPLAGWLLTAKGSRRLRRGSGDAVKVKEGIFLKKYGYTP
ncbi:hypothetical protein BHM03_00057894 [Ensete ventricosum]|nr:hypothetical protein BHM03_00057894 [Ensete ventricosum]